MIQVNNSVAVEYAMPPSFGGNQLGYMFALFGIVMLLLLALNWLWRKVWKMIDDPQPLNSPTTLLRLVLIGLMVAALMRGGPDAVLLLQWPELDVAARQQIATIDRSLDGLAVIPFFGAWLLYYMVAEVLTFQLERRPPPPTDVWPRPRSWIRPAQIALGSLAISFAVVFLQ